MLSVRHAAVVVMGLAAACLAQADECEGRTTCTDNGQLCVDPNTAASSTGDWYCNCGEYRGRAEGRVALCHTLEIFKAVDECTQCLETSFYYNDGLRYNGDILHDVACNAQFCGSTCSKTAGCKYASFIESLPYDPPPETNCDRGRPCCLLHGPSATRVTNAPGWRGYHPKEGDSDGDCHVQDGGAVRVCDDAGQACVDTNVETFQSWLCVCEAADGVGAKRRAPATCYEPAGARDVDECVACAKEMSLVGEDVRYAGGVLVYARSNVDAAQCRLECLAADACEHVTWTAEWKTDDVTCARYAPCCELLRDVDAAGGTTPTPGTRTEVKSDAAPCHRTTTYPSGICDAAMQTCSDRDPSTPGTWTCACAGGAPTGMLAPADCPTSLPPTPTPPTNRPPSPSPPTPAPPTRAPPTGVPTTASPPTPAPQTPSPPTPLPAAGTLVPPTGAPATPLPPTPAPPTPAPATSAPPTSAPVMATDAPSTVPPPTRAPPTAAPATTLPATSAPMTPAPSTGEPAPSTAAPPTSAPPTPAPATATPWTSVPWTSVPTTLVPATPAPTTSMPSTSAPRTSVPTTSTPPTYGPAAVTVAPLTTAPPTSVPPTPAPFATASPPPIVAALVVPGGGTDAPVAALTSGGRDRVVASASTAAVFGAIAGGSPGALRLAVAAAPCVPGGVDAAARYMRPLAPLQLAVGGDRALGAVLGNVALAVGAWLLGYAVAVLGRWYGARVFPRVFSELDAQGVTLFPSAPLAVFQVAYQGTSLAAMDLVENPETVAGCAVGVLGVTVCIVVPFSVTSTVRRAVPVLARVRPDPIEAAVKRFFLGDYEWVSDSRAYNWAMRWSVAIRPYTQRAAWFACVEYSAMFAVAAAAATVPDDWTGCGHVAVAMAVIFTMMLALEIGVWPHIHYRNGMFDVMLLGGQAAGAAATAVGYYNIAADVSPRAPMSVAGTLMEYCAVVVCLRVLCDVAGAVWNVVCGRRARLQQVVWEGYEERDGGLREGTEERALAQTQTLVDLDESARSIAHLATCAMPVTSSGSDAAARLPFAAGARGCGASDGGSLLYTPLVPPHPPPFPSSADSRALLLPCSPLQAAIQGAGGQRAMPSTRPRPRHLAPLASL